jgi:hypothetical protein
LPIIGCTITSPSLIVLAGIGRSGNFSSGHGYLDAPNFLVDGVSGGNIGYMLVRLVTALIGELLAGLVTG